MAETSSPELRERNVKLHHRGQTQLGSLVLGRDHLVFTYAVDDAQAVSTEPQGRTSSQSQHKPIISTESSTVSHPSLEVPASEAAVGRSATKVGSERRKPRTKSTWVAYPMINHCVLRPSHLLNHSRASTVDDERHDDLEAGIDGSDDMFPPSYGTSTYSRPSTDSARLGPFASPRRPDSPVVNSARETPSFDSGRSPSLRMRCRDFRMMAYHFQAGPGDNKSVDEVAREFFFTLRSRCCPNKIEDMLAFHFTAPPEEKDATLPPYDARREFARMGIGEKAPDGPGSAWRVTDINHDYAYSPTYPSLICVPRAVSDNLLKYGGEFRSKSRIPALSYLHSNGASITRSSQPKVGVQGKRNPQDERLVSAIFSSHTPPISPTSEHPPALPNTTDITEPGVAGESEVEAVTPNMNNSQHEKAIDDNAQDRVGNVKRKVYGSSRRNLIVDARPRLNALANRATGGGIEDISNYMGNGDVPVERIMLNIQNIHVMRESLQKIVDSLGNADYLSMPPDQELLRKSGWLGHIAGLLEGSELVAKAVGLRASHALVHCSDGWDRTAQVSALAQLMLDPYARTFEGYINLIRKEFILFGHKFNDRNGTMGSEKWFEIENERIQPSRSRDEGSPQPGSLNAFGTKALTGAKSWFEKNRANLFRQQNSSEDNLAEASSRPASPPPNPLLHSPAATNGKDDKEHRISEKEISPVFHQFLDATYQLLRQTPTAFDFNERFLLRLLYQVYAGQYGEFLFNCERERAQYAGRLPSVWGHFFARRGEFINAEYVAVDSVLFSKRGSDGEVEVRWWSKLFGCSDEQMNVPRALLARPEPPALDLQTSSLSLDDAIIAVSSRTNEGAATTALRAAKSTPVLGAAKDYDAGAGGSLSVDQRHDTEINTVIVDKVTETPQRHEAETSTAQVPVSGPSSGVEEDDDPLGVTSSQRVQTGTVGGRLDGAAFAPQNAFKD
ncbi:phosphatidylinositol-3-phosphatase ymr1 [Recurvomyces mirabilis]|nr:phosphatidylinositol-3-phosphatase ymr1 [Recurvomyces mirabilis]